MLAILDSGVGGFEILYKIKQKWPKLRVLYHADTQNFPYGSKTEEELVKILQKNYENFINSGAKTAIIACNTASVISHKHFQTQYKTLKLIDLYEILDKIEREIGPELIYCCTELTAKTLKNDANFRNSHIIALQNLVQFIENSAKMADFETISYFGDKNLMDNKSNYINHQTFSPNPAKMAENNENSSQKIDFEKISELKKFLLEKLEKIQEKNAEKTAKKATIVFACTHFPLASAIFRSILPTANFLNPADKILSNLSVENFETIKNDSEIEFSNHETEKKYKKLEPLLKIL